MFDLLFARTFIIVGIMLVITAVTSRINKAFETSMEAILTIGATFALLFGIIFFADIYPLNLALVALFSGLIGWEIGPTIEHYSKSFKFKKFLKSKGVKIEKGKKVDPALSAEFENYMQTDPNTGQWSKIVSQALFGTAFAVLATAGMVFLTNIDFSFLGAFLFIALIILIVMGLLNIFFFKSALISLLQAYAGVVIFTGYLLYDFNILEKSAGDDSWGTAVRIAVNIYLDIINIFLNLLAILSSSSD